MTSTHPTVAELAGELLATAPPETMPSLWRVFRRITAERLALAIRDYEARMDAHDLLWGLWTDRAAEAAVAGGAT